MSVGSVCVPSLLSLRRLHWKRRTFTLRSRSWRSRGCAAAMQSDVSPVNGEGSFRDSSNGSLDCFRNDLSVPFSGIPCKCSVNRGQPLHCSLRHRIAHPLGRFLGFGGSLGPEIGV